MPTHDIIVDNRSEKLIDHPSQILRIGKRSAALLIIGIMLPINAISRQQAAT